MTLHYLQHTQIDKPRWDATIRNSANGRIYAWAIYLDHFSPGWAALVNEDYSLVMPLTCKKKYGISYLYQPPFCQQLGVFGISNITETTMAAFITAARKQFSFGEIFLNDSNASSTPSGFIVHKNYLLHLAGTYPNIAKGYTNDLLKKNLQRTLKFNLQYRVSNDIEQAIVTFKQLYSDRTPHVTDSHYTALITLATQLQTTGNAFVRTATLPNGELLACGLFLKDEKRIYNIASSTLPNGRTFEANHFLFNQLIQEFATSGLTLDFEGSDIPGIERFYQKFGAINQPYYYLKWNALPWPWRLFKK